jgi:hypothetical protein
MGSKRPKIILVTTGKQRTDTPGVTDSLARTPIRMRCLPPVFVVIAPYNHESRLPSGAHFLFTGLQVTEKLEPRENARREWVSPDLSFHLEQSRGRLAEEFLKSYLDI